MAQKVRKPIEHPATRSTVEGVREAIQAGLDKIALSPGIRGEYGPPTEQYVRAPSGAIFGGETPSTLIMRDREEMAQAITGLQDLQDLLYRVEHPVQPTTPGMGSRKQFRDSWMAANGNPFRINVRAQTNSWMQTNMQNLWNHFFDGQIPWGGKLTKHQADDWNEFIEEVYADRYNQFKGERDMLVEDFKFAMGEYEKDREERRQAGAIETWMFKEEYKAALRDTEKGPKVEAIKGAVLEKFRVGGFAALDANETRILETMLKTEKVDPAMREANRMLIGSGAFLGKKPQEMMAMTTKLAKMISTVGMYKQKKAKFKTPTPEVRKKVFDTLLNNFFDGDMDKLRDAVEKNPDFIDQLGDAILMSLGYSPTGYVTEKES